MGDWNNWLAEALEALAAPSNWPSIGALILLQVWLNFDNLALDAVEAGQENAREATRRQLYRGAVSLVVRFLLLGLAQLVLLYPYPIFDLGFVGPIDVSRGTPTFETSFSWFDVIQLVGGLLLVWLAATRLWLLVAMGRTAKSITSGPLYRTMLDWLLSVSALIAMLNVFDNLFLLLMIFAVSDLVLWVLSWALRRYLRFNASSIILLSGFLFLLGTVSVADSVGIHLESGIVLAVFLFAGAIDVLTAVHMSRQVRAG